MGATGTTTINFGAFPGSIEAQTDVSGQSGLISSSKIEAWVQPIATADHSIDEHLIERLQVRAAYKIDGTLTIRGCEDASPVLRDVNPRQAEKALLQGLYTVGWAWL